MPFSSPTPDHRFSMAEKTDYEHAEPQKGDDIYGDGVEQLSAAEDKRLLRRIDMWYVALPGNEGITVFS